MGTRVRYQRLSDARFFSGWVQSFRGGLVVVRSRNDVALLKGDEFLFHIYGQEAIAVFVGKFTGNDDLEVMRTADFQYMASSQTQIITVKELDFEFEVTSQVRQHASSGDFRLSVSSMTAQIRIDEENTFEVSVLDISDKGIGMLSQNNLNRGDLVTVDLFTPAGLVTAPAEVRYCRPEIGVTGFYRLGLRILELERAALQRWKQALEEAA